MPAAGARGFSTQRRLQQGFVLLPAWVIYAHFGALNTGEWVGGVIAKGGQEAQGGWVVPRTRPNPRSTPKSFACGAKLFIGLAPGFDEIRDGS